MKLKYFRRLSARKRFWVILSLILVIYLINASWLVRTGDKKPFLLAHRGLAQTFPMAGITNETCTAKGIYPPEHPYLENTIASMQAAFDHGADIVELDIQLTADNEFAVFHDWTLECRTDGQGVTREHTLGELKELDIGYGYTADGGQTYPFRGKGVGLLPSLSEVLDAFPIGSCCLTLRAMIRRKELDWQSSCFNCPERLETLAVYGGDEPIAALKEAIPQLRVMSMATLKRALLSYLAVGWSGYVPAAMRNTQLHIPEKFAPFLWGWPHRFLQRMEAVDTRIILVAGSGKFSEGFDSAEDLARIPKGYSGGIWTNRIDRLAPLVK